MMVWQWFRAQDAGISRNSRHFGRRPYGRFRLDMTTHLDLTRERVAG
jgi:hypothetical protein